MIKTTLVVVLLAIFVATIQAANPFDTNNRPFVIGGAFKRVEKKSPAASFACYNTTLGDWSDYKWVDASISPASNGVSTVQLNNGHLLFLKKVSGAYGFVYWNLDSSVVITTTANVMEATGSPITYLSYDQKKIYVAATFTRVGTNTFTDGKYRIFSFDLTTLPSLPAPTEVSSSYGLTYSLGNPSAVYAVSNNNQLLFLYRSPTFAFVVYDPTSTSWKEINPTVIRADSEFKIHSGTGELYAKSYDTNSPYASSFWKYDSGSSQYFTNVKTLASSTYVTALNAASYVKVWTVGTGGLYYAVQVDTTGTNFENGMQNIQRITLSPSVSDPVSLSKTRLSISTSRTIIDTYPISAHINFMYYDENIKQLVIVMNTAGTETVYQVYGTRDTDLTKKVYELSYRLQQMPLVVAYDATADAFVVPYGGSFAAAPSLYNPYPSTASVSCFNLASYYRTWAPNFAVYDQGKDMFVAENLLSGQIDYDWLNSAAPTVNAIENSDDSSIVYVGGYFRTISGNVYNSIVARTKSGLVALGTGLRKHNFNYYYFDTQPGTVTKLIRSKDNKYLFVMGDFDRAGDVSVNGLAYWNIEKKTWNKLETNSKDGIVDIDYDGRYLYAIGTISRAGKYVVKNAARFDMESQTWLPMNGGLNSAATAGYVVDGKFVAISASSGSAVSFHSNLAVWSSNSWKAIEMDSVSNSGCYSQAKEQCTNQISWVAMTYFKGKIYFLNPQYVYVSDTSMSKGTLYINGPLPVTASTRFFNYPKSNTVAVADIAGTTFTEYNIDTKNIQHTNTRDNNQLADDAINAISSAPKTVFTALALIVTLIVTLFF